MLARIDTVSRMLVGSIVLVAGCAYQPDSFSYARNRPAGVQLSVDCLDLSVAHRKEYAQDVLSYQFGNRCDEPAMVDLAAARVVGDTHDGAVVELYAFDPLREVRAMRIDSRAVGGEAIAYPSDVPVTTVCVDAASIARVTPSRWICFRD